MAFIAPKIIGGTSAPNPVGELGLSMMTDALQLKNIKIKAMPSASFAIASDILVEGYL